MLVEAINNLWNNTLLDKLTLIANIIIGLSAILSLRLSRESLKQVKIESKNSQDFQFALKKQDLEQWVLREDILITVIPVYSSDWFSKINNASWSSWLLKVSKNSQLMWEYIIIDPVHYIDWNTWEKIWSQERECLQLKIEIQN